MSKWTLSPKYAPQLFETQCRSMWSRGLSRSYPNGPYSMVLPPPNVTGRLHVGHALTCTIQDTLARWKIMKGFEVQWIPGLDHAGIATQSTVERHISPVTRHDLGREAFIDKVWTWKGEYGSAINDQMKRMGLLLDWDKAVFTMDDARSRAVTKAFITLFDDGLIYRSNRLIQWCPHLRTALSDIEVDMISVSEPCMMPLPGGGEVRMGEAYVIGYPVEESSKIIYIETTRPETLFGDVAVAVHSSDTRYTHLVGQRVSNPITGELLPILCDDELVDPMLGTGAVKITPAHDPNDYMCRQRHQLPSPIAMDEQGCIVSSMQEWNGLDRFEARRILLSTLDSKGLLREVRDKEMAVPVCSRSGDIIEPMLKPQFYIDCSKLAPEASEIVRHGDIVIQPDFYRPTWHEYLDQGRDWCISRQLWWGHRIPAYRIQHESLAEEVWVAAETQESAIEKVCLQYGWSRNTVSAEQDDDVLDTWFSSGLFPLAALGWPDTQSPCRYPLSIMVTGSDILFFWVARMMMLCTHLSGSAPFHHIFLHQMIRDSTGKKMSKSKGNVIDPLSLIEGDVGVDPLRMALCSYMEQERNINLDVQRVHVYQRFANKMWQATRFYKQRAKSTDTEIISLEHCDAFDTWILAHVAKTIEQVDAAFGAMDFAKAMHTLHEFFIHHFCDVYIEVSKHNDPYGQRFRILRHCLVTFFKLGHPIFPHVSEALYQELNDAVGDSILNCRYPSEEGLLPLQGRKEDITAVNRFLHILNGIRHVLHENTDLQTRKSAKIVLVMPETEALEDTTLASVLSKCASVDVETEKPNDIFKDFVLDESCTIVLMPLPVPVELKQDAERQQKLVQKELKKLSSDLSNLLKQLSNPTYQNNAPLKVQQKHQQRLAEIRARISVLETRLSV